MNMQAARPIAAKGWRASFLSTLFPSHDWSSLLRVATELGADGIEPRIGAGHAHGVEPETDALLLDRSRSALAGDALEVPCLATPFRLGTTEASVFQRGMAVRRALGASGMRVFVDVPSSGTSDAELRRQIDAAVLALERLGEDTSSIWVENHGAASQLSRLEALIPEPVGIVWDIGHSVSAGEAWQRSLEALPRIRHVHVKNWQSSDRGWDRNVALLDGGFAIASILTALDDRAYCGFVSAEVIPERGIEAIKALVEQRKLRD